MATTADFRNGLCIEFSNGLYQIIEFQHVKPGKGSAFVRTKLRNLATGRVIENTFSSGVQVTTARIERRKHQFLYKDEYGYNFMNSATFEQVMLEDKLVQNVDLMKDGQETEILFHADTETPLFCELPPFVELEINYTEPALKGDTTSGVTKPATLETGATIRVPLFVGQGEKIRVDTRTYEYVERVK